ncbi:hypothetical protein JN11_04216 [Mucilaginibacter frigoritolerans]|jgi:hypothetical protein|uniref:Uncharacterized protein n=1 Tax=Mucilaginibacter frigoritolerans TaxID=652788 RepID=A0A562TQR1_9SPHI|nr:hypothetical protein [Mucilaginibacter frigoritolerans]TWI95941.1 hypothetical protein JN11_04216 [Mucilaginibacter frigoritolerans]
MHPEIEAVLKNADNEDIILNYITIANAEKLLNYIEDINLQRTGRFEFTPADSLYLLWQIDNMEIHIECLSNGKILYTFRNKGRTNSSGISSVDEFIYLLEKYLLTSIF